MNTISGNQSSKWQYVSTVYEINLYRISGGIGHLELDEAITRRTFLALKVHSYIIKYEER